MDKRFVLRHAAGTYWLIDLEQDPAAYKEPMSFIKTGAEVIELLEEGKKTMEIAAIISDRYNSKPEDVLEDIVSFEMQLKDFGYNI